MTKVPKELPFMNGSETRDAGGTDNAPRPRPVKHHHPDFLLRIKVGDIPIWLALLGVMAYASGILIVTTFLDTYGIHDGVSDFFRARYIVVGSLFLLISLTLIVPILSMFYLVKRETPPHVTNEKDAGTGDDPQEPAGQEDHRAHWMMIPLITHMLLFLYAFAAFAPPHFFMHKQLWVLGVIAAHIVAAASLRCGIPTFIKEGFQRKLANWLRLILLMFFLILDYSALFPDAWNTLVAMCVNGGYIWLAYIALIIFFGHRMGGRLLHSTDPVNRGFWVAVGACLMIGLCFIMTLAYAHRVYPYIPSGKNGGDFTDTKLSVLVFKDADHMAVPPDILDVPSQQCREREIKTPASMAATQPKPELLRSVPLVIIEETQDDMYVAKPEGREEWRAGTTRPAVFRVPRSSVGNVSP